MTTGAAPSSYMRHLPQIFRTPAAPGAPVFLGDFLKIFEALLTGRDDAVLPGLTESALTAVHVDPGNPAFGWAVGADGTILATVDGGSTWTQQSSGAPLHAIQFVGIDVGWAVGGAGTILATTDRGATWIPRDGGAADLFTVHFVDASRGWVAGEGGTILATSDGGNTWTPQPSGTGARLARIRFADATHGFAVGDDGTILATADGGATWQLQNSQTTADLAGIHVFDATRALAVGAGGTIRVTTNGGALWSGQVSGTDQDLAAVSFVDATTGWLVGAGGTILATTDGGASWAPRSAGTTAGLASVQFVDADHGRIVGADGVILATSDGGTTWVAQGAGAKVPGIEEIVEGFVRYLDPAATPVEATATGFLSSPFLDYLASWVGLVQDQNWDLTRKRQSLQRVVPLYKRRGTRAGIQAYLEMFVGPEVKVNEFPGGFILADAEGSTLGEDTFLGGAPPHVFRVGINYGFPPQPFEIGVWQNLQAGARAVVDREKPAHTHYTLDARTLGIVIAERSTVAVDTLIWERSARL